MVGGTNASTRWACVSGKTCVSSVGAFARHHDPARTDETGACAGPHMMVDAGCTAWSPEVCKFNQNTNAVRVVRARSMKLTTLSDGKMGHCAARRAPACGANRHAPTCPAPGRARTTPTDRRDAATYGWTVPASRVPARVRRKRNPNASCRVSVTRNGSKSNGDRSGRD